MKTRWLCILSFIYIFCWCSFSGFIPEGANINKLREEIIHQREVMKQRYKKSVNTVEIKSMTRSASKGITPSVMQTGNSSHSKQGVKKKSKQVKKIPLKKVPYWLQVLLAVVFIAGLWIYLLRLSYKYKKRVGFSLLELMFAMAIFVVVLGAISAIYKPVKILFARINSDLDRISVSQRLNYLIFKKLSALCADSDHKIDISSGGSKISFYVCKSKDGDSGVDFIGPIELYVSSGKVFMKQDGVAHPIGQDVSSLQFTYADDKIIVHEILCDGAEFFSQVAVRVYD